VPYADNRITVHQQS